jgi:hypothetical protein
MIFYAICLNPLLRTLNDTITGIKTGRQNVRTSVAAFADDVTLFITSPSDIPKLQDAMKCYEELSGAKINLRKSRVVALGTLDRSIDLLNIPFHDNATILGLQVQTTVSGSALSSWMKTTALIRLQAQDT